MNPISRFMLASVAAEIRSADAVLSSVVAQLQQAHVWSGEDADRFQREWHDLVSHRLQTAALRVDSANLTTFP